MLSRLEKPTAILLIALSLFLTGRMAVAMATHSLSTDEFGTVGSFSSKGPLNVITDYRAPKNHIFFNLLNSLLPARESFDTARVRALSILATLLTAGILIAWAAWRKQLLEVAVLLALWSSAPQMLQLSMEARGYGFIGLFAITASLAIFEYLRSPHPRWLWVLGVSVALGTWTIPAYLFFGGPLMLLLWAADRKRATLLAGALTVAAILILYAPVLTRLVAEFTGFHEDKAEADFVAVHAVVRAVKLYLFQGEDWESWTLFLLLALAPFAVHAGENSECSALRIIVGACLACLAILFLLRTPPIRVAAFTLLPLALAGFLAIGGWLRKCAPVPLRFSAAALAGLVLLAHLADAALTFDFTPTEDWQLAGRAIDTAFPKTTRVDFKRYAKYLKQTLPDGNARQADYDANAFAQGGLVVAEAANKWAGERQFHPPGDLPRVVEWTIPGTIRDIVLTFRIPDPSGLKNAPASLTDGNLKTSAAVGALSLHPEPLANARALALLFDRPPKSGELNGPPDMLIAGNAVVIPLQAGHDEEIHLTAATGSNLKVAEAWITR